MQASQTHCQKQITGNGNRKDHIFTFLRFIFFGLAMILPFSATIASIQATDSTENGTPTIFSQFTQASIRTDGVAEPAWSAVKPYRIAIAMTANLSDPAQDCTTYGEVRSLWDGALLYFLIDVNDTDVTAVAEKPTDQDGVEIYLDYWNDKFPKYEEDDGIIRVSSTGELSGSGVYSERLQSYAAAKKYEKNTQIGYTIELAIHSGGIPMKNGSSVGMDFGINDAFSSTNTCQYRVFWSDGKNKGLNDNTRWGNVVLTGYDGKSPMAPDTFRLSSNIKRATGLPRGVWTSEAELDPAIITAKSVITEPTQLKMDSANTTLERAMNRLRRKGKYPDPFDLPVVKHLTDPFSFFDGRKVKSGADWSARRKEIRELAQYYEYGYMPKSPEEVLATVNGNVMTIKVRNEGKTASFNAVLTVPTISQCGKPGPYPVIVSIDFRAGEARSIFLNAGYAVLSIVYSSVASDNFEHTGAFYSLYPYDVTTGNDAGTLLAWAWGASRGADALTYLAEKDPVYTDVFDLKKLVVTGFSRCGKAALLAGFMDERFGVVNPGASGCGGAAVYRYDSFGNTPFRSAPFGNVYSWGVSPGCEVLPDKIRHQGHNSNQMLSRFLNSPRIYKTNTHGYGERLPYDHHEIIAAIAPRAVMINTANDDYANNAEGDCIGMEGAKPVYRFLDAEENLALNIRTTGEPNPRGWGGGHWIDDNQIKNLVEFSNMVFYGKPLSEELKAKFYTNPYLPTFETYYGGLTQMMPWAKTVPKKLSGK